MIDYDINRLKFDTDFSKIGEDGLRYFRDASARVFQTVSDNLRTQKERFESRDPALKPIGPSDTLTAQEKAAMIAKRIGKTVASFAAVLTVNTLISHFTGIDPVFLDNEIMLLGKPSERTKYYMNCSLTKLLYTVVCDLADGTGALLERLQAADPQTARRMLSEIQQFELHSYDPDPEENKSGIGYEMVLLMLLHKLQFLDSDQVFRAMAMAERGHKLIMPVDFVGQIAEAYEEYRAQFVFRSSDKDTGSAKQEQSARPKADANAGFDAWKIEGSSWLRCPQCGEKRPGAFIRAVRKCPVCGLQAFPN
jgi:hypothetical protein